MSHVRTPRFCERRWKWLLSLHLFRWGFHVKRRRPSGRWWHLVVKMHRGSALGQKHARRMIWIGWWTSYRGARGKLNGVRLIIACDRLPAEPAPTISIPFFPQNPREDVAA